MFVLGIFAETSRTSLIDWSSSQTTWDNIVQARMIYTLTIIAFIVIILLDSAIAIGLFTILKFRNTILAPLMAVLRLVYVAIKAVSLAGMLLAADVYFSGRYGEESASLALTFLKFHDLGFGVGLVVFGIHLLLLAYLARETQFPKWIWLMLGIAGIGYVVNSLSSSLVQDDLIQTIVITIFIVPMTFSEVAFFMWLWFKGNAIGATPRHDF